MSILDKRHPIDIVRPEIIEGGGQETHIECWFYPRYGHVRQDTLAATLTDGYQYYTSSASATCTSTLGPAERGKTILLSLSSTKELTVDSPNTVQVREIVEDLTQAISKNQLAFGAFSETLVKVLQSALELPQTCTMPTMPKRGEIMWDTIWPSTRLIYTVHLR